MPKIIKISKGLDIRLKGAAEKTITAVTPKYFAIKPTDFVGVFPRLLVKEGDTVEAGSPVFIDKYRDNITFTSPVSGTITEIKRGDKRLLLEIRIESDETNTLKNFGIADPKTLSKEEITSKLLESGVWTMIRQRPYNVIAKPEDMPRAIFVTAFDTAPLAPDMDFIVNGQGAAFQAGIDALAKLGNTQVHLNVSDKTAAKEFLNSTNTIITTFKGPHPAGNVGIQIHHIKPINKGEVVWTAGVQDVIAIGNLFLKGIYDPTIIVALAGSEVTKPHYFKTLRCGEIEPMTKGIIAGDNVRYISGNVLSGAKIRHDNYINFYHSMVTVIPEGDHHEFLGWALPGFDKFSLSRTFFSWLTPKKKYVLDTNLNGGERALVMTGKYEQVFPMDIYPMQLIKAIITEDIDLMENLGIYEVEPEDMALCEFIDTSKTEIQTLVRMGLEVMRKEMS